MSHGCDKDMLPQGEAKGCGEMCAPRGDNEEEEVAPRNDDFRGKKAKGFFLTYAKCPLEKEVLLKLLEPICDLVGGMKEYVIAREKHQDGSYHLHAFVKLNRRQRWIKDRFDVYDSITGKKYHCNCQVAKSWGAVKTYVKKDHDYIASFNVKSAMAKKGKMKKEDLLREVDDVLDEGIITPMQVASFYKNQCVYKMLINNKRKMPDELPPKKRHQWNYGESNSGKTTRLREFIRTYGEENCFQIPTNNDWVGYNDQKYLYLDEYIGQLTIQQLNAICDGGAKVNVKGGTVQLRYDVTVIICSNKSIRECYAKAEDRIIETLYNRFDENYYEFDPDYGKENLIEPQDGDADENK